jgi:tRNA(Ile)-lysidine synthase
LGLRYHVPVLSLAQGVLAHIRQQEFLHAGERVGVAVSGGIDSVALLRLLLEIRGELGIVLSVVHFNHKLRGAESDADQEFVANLAREHHLEFHTDGDDVAQHAAEEHISVEAAARELRYGFFRSLIEEGPSGAKAPTRNQALDRSAGSAAAPESETPGLKPDSEGAAFRGAATGPTGGRALSRLNKIVTAHTLDDQAETVLQRIIRGAGIKGLGGIHPRIAVENDDGEICGEIVRPLLAFRRRELERYLKAIEQPWREDSTNDDVKFTRNRLRQRVLPLLEKEFNPDVAEGLAELAEIARGEEDYWENEIAGWMGTGVHWSEPAWARRAPDLVQIEVSRGAPSLSAAKNDLRQRIESSPWLVMNASVDRLWFLGEPAAVQRRLIKAIGDEAGIPLTFRHIEEVLHFAMEPNASGKELSLPLGWKMTRNAHELVFLTPDLRQSASADYEYELPVPGQTAVAELGTTLEAWLIPADAVAAYNPEHLLDAESLPGPLRVRNWRPGDRFWPAHTKSPRKIKELLQDRHIAEPERKLWPVVLSGLEMIWVRGFPSPTKFRAKPGSDAILIAEHPTVEEPAT